MKGKILLFSMFLFFLANVFSQTETKASTSFEQFLMKKGSLFSKEIIKFGEFPSKPSSIIGEIAILTDVNTGAKVYALRVSTLYFTKYDIDTIIGVFDVAEIDSAINSIKYMIKTRNAGIYKDGYTEIEYKGSGDPSIGYYHNVDEEKAFFKINYKQTNYFEVSQIESLLTFFEQAKNKIIELGGKFK